MASEKTWIVEKIFEDLWDSEGGCLKRSEVTFEDIISGIHAYNIEKGAKVSAANPANFFYDLTRRIDAGNRNWPRSIFERGFTAWQLTGGGRSFAFVPIPEGQNTPFVSAINYPDRDTPKHEISSISIPMPVRQLARADESSLLQLVVRLRIIEAHMSLYSSKREIIRHMEHVQNSVKLRLSEIDAVFIATEGSGQGMKEFLVACEAKALNEDVSMAQVLRQPIALLDAMPEQRSVVPVVVRALGDSEFQVVEFEEVFRERVENAERWGRLAQRSHAVFRLRPGIVGLQKKSRYTQKQNASNGRLSKESGQ